MVSMRIPGKLVEDLRPYVESAWERENRPISPAQVMIRSGQLLLKKLGHHSPSSTSRRQP